MSKLKLAATLLLALATSAGAANVCASPDSVHQSVAINASATARLVVGTATTRVHVCGFSFTAAAGTTATYTLSEGTGTTCGTSNVADTGAFAGASAEVVEAEGREGDVFVTLMGNDLCITMGGSGNSAQGILTYVQL